MATSSTFDLDRIGGQKNLNALISEILAAGEDALSLYRGGAGARAKTKPDRSPVTEADEAVEKRLRAFMEKHFSNVGFLGEESGESAQKSSMRFIVDPIDGTRAFMRGHASWSVLVGLEADAEPVIGIAYQPARNDLFVAVRGAGATGNGRPLRVSTVQKLSESLICHGGLNQFTAEGYGQKILKVAEAAYTMRGLADFDGYRAVMEGKGEAMVDPGLKPWDLCAPAVLVREAGGTLTSLTGESTIYGGGALSSNGLVHAELLACLSA